MVNSQRHIYNSLLRKHEEIERKVLELVRHPDATAEDLMQARETYKASTERVRKAYILMLNKYGIYAGIRPPEGVKQ